MARRATKPIQVEPKHRCRECAHSSDWCNKSVAGRYILCRCDYRKHYHFLSDPQCEHFVLRRTDAQAQE